MKQSAGADACAPMKNAGKGKEGLWGRISPTTKAKKKEETRSQKNTGNLQGNAVLSAIGPNTKTKERRAPTQDGFNGGERKGEA